MVWVLQLLMSMRQLIMFNWMTADGYFSGPDGNLDWVVPDDEQTKAAAKTIGGVDTALFGRRTYELFEKFWPNALDESGTAPDPHRPGQRSKELGTLARGINEMTKLVFSRTLEKVTWKNSRIVREFDPDAIAKMKHQPGKDMIIWGSGSVVSQLTQHDLIDAYQFVVCPVLLGSGRTLLNGISKRLRLNLVESRQYPSGDVILRFGRGARPV